MKQPPKAKSAAEAKPVAAKAGAATAALAKAGPAESAQSLVVKLLIELGPLLVFFGGNAAAGIYAGTAAFMVATLIALAVAMLRYHKVPIMPLVSGVIVLLFGGLTLYLRDDTFIKLKPTIVYVMFAALLGAGLWLKKPLLELLLGPVFRLSEVGWRKLTWRWMLFFAAMAVLNELVWRHVSTDAWVSFKAFGFLPLTFLFALTQVPLMQRYSEPNEEEGAAGSHRDGPPRATDG
jgi:intracellular septation protein